MPDPLDDERVASISRLARATSAEPHDMIVLVSVPIVKSGKRAAIRRPDIGDDRGKRARGPFATGRISDCGRQVKSLMKRLHGVESRRGRLAENVRERNARHVRDIACDR
jgi:hypothetical protein